MSEAKRTATTSVSEGSTMDALQIDASSPVYAVIGDPVAHSLGPVMHNRALAVSGLPGVYVAFRVADAAGAMAAVRSLGIRGASVTLPHKTAVMDHLDAVDETARAIGAVNTVSLQDGRLVGSNTDRVVRRTPCAVLSVSAK